MGRLDKKGKEKGGKKLVSRFSCRTYSFACSQTLTNIAILKTFAVWSSPEGKSGGRPDARP